jgi:predicted nucleic acid-binding protein
VSVYVVDANVAWKWYVPEVHQAEARRLLDGGHELHVPDLLYIELGNTLWKWARRGELSHAQAHGIAKTLLSTPLTSHSSASLVASALDIALLTGCAGYDATYVALAASLGERFVTADHRLLNALAGTRLRKHVIHLENLP